MPTENDTITVTFFENKAAFSLKTLDLNWEEVVERLRNPKEFAHKHDCPLIKLATFGTQRSLKDSLRHDANITSITGVEGDYDGGQVSIEDASMMLHENGIDAVLYTSPSHTPEKPRWRVLCRLSNPYNPSERRKFLGRVNGALGGILGDESFTLSQSFFIGRVNGCEYKVQQVRGTFIDHLDYLDEGAIFPVKSSETKLERLDNRFNGDPIVKKLLEKNLVKSRRTDGSVNIICPFTSSHTSPDDSDSATTYFPANTGGYAQWHIKCLHGHCANRTSDDYREALGLSNEQKKAQVAHFLGISEFLSTLEAPTWLINGMVQCGYVYAVTGHTSHGKTIVASLLAAVVASGREFAGRKTSGSKVLYMAGENQQDFGWHLAATLQYLNISPQTLDDKFFIMPQRDTLSALYEETKEFCKKVDGVSLIIVDTSAAYSGVIDENANAQVISHALAMREMTRCTGHPAVIALCHPSKNATKDSLDPRGGSSFLCEIDANITVSMADGIIEIGHTKIRGPSFGTINLQLEIVDIHGRADSEGNKITSSIAKYISESQAEAVQNVRSDENDLVLLLLVEFPNIPMREMASKLGWKVCSGEDDGKAVQRALKRLEKDKLVEQLSNRKYRATQLGRNVAKKLNDSTK